MHKPWQSKSHRFDGLTSVVLCLTSVVLCLTSVCVVLCCAVCRMTSLLQKFRISFSEVIEVAGINDKPSRERWASFVTSHQITSYGHIKECGYI